MSADTRLRPVVAGDYPFLLTVYRSTREDELALVPWTDAQKHECVLMQFNAQDKNYREAYPDGQFLVIESQGQAVGRLYRAYARGVLHVIDIALLPAWRKRGIGTAMIEAIMHEACAQGVAVQLYVEQWNPAQRLYARLGFRLVQDQGIYQLLECHGVDAGAILGTASAQDGITASD